MNSSQLHLENTIRLLDIVYGLHGTDKAYPYQSIPFSGTDDGNVLLSPYLLAELEKAEHADLMAWAHNNIAYLFE